MLRLAVVAATAVVALIPIPSAPGATECATNVLRDWSDDGRVASKYSPPCYEEAIDALPTDLRDYTNAEDVITRALTSAVRYSSPSRHPASESQPDVGVPVAVLALAATALLVVSAGGIATVARLRRRGAHS